MRFDADTYEKLAVHAFATSYRGYRPNVAEAPNGDGRVDAQKRYSHLATKYFDANTPEIMVDALLSAFRRAESEAAAFRVPLSLHRCALRLLDYPPGVGSHEHADFDLFTLNLWRSDPSALKVRVDSEVVGLHCGELMWELYRVLPTYHWVESRTYGQRSMVFFALPSHDLRLPGGDTVGAWLEERLSRSRVESPVK